MGKWKHLTIALTVITLQAGDLKADDGPSPSLLSLKQIEQDVEIIVEVPETLIERVYILARGVVGGQKQSVFEGTFTDVREDEEGEDCYEPSYDFCKENVELCNDCDQDGEPECRQKCYGYYRYSVVDECVGAGGYEYSFSDEAKDYIMIREIEVIDSKKSCSADAGDGEIEADGGEEPDSSTKVGEGDLSSCGVVKVGRTRLSFLVAIFMGAVGILALRVARI